MENKQNVYVFQKEVGGSQITNQLYYVEVDIQILFISSANLNNLAHLIVILQIISLLEIYTNHH